MLTATIVAEAKTLISQLEDNYIQRIIDSNTEFDLTDWECVDHTMCQLEDIVNWYLSHPNTTLPTLQQLSEVAKKAGLDVSPYTVQMDEPNKA